MVDWLVVGLFFALVIAAVVVVRAGSDQLQLD
jgi:hypothetical protein